MVQWGGRPRPPAAGTAAILACAAALASAIGAGCRSAAPLEKIPRPVKVQQVGGFAAAAGLRYSASIQANQQVALAFKASGYVEELLQRAGAGGRARDLQQGDLVARGEVLARVDPSDDQERVDQARAQLAEVQASLDKARLDRERAERLFASKSLTKPELDGALASFEVAAARVQAAQAQLQGAEIALRDCALIAPLDAVVLSRSVERGSLAALGTVAFTLAEVRQVKAVFGVPDLMIGRLELGDRLPLAAEALGSRQFQGRVSAISPAADLQSRVFQVELTIANPDGLLRPGMIASVTVPDPNAAPSAVAGGLPVVPLSAIVRSPADPKAYAVMVVEGGEQTVARARTVELGEFLGNTIAVRAGLSAGERVIVGAALVTDGEEVRVIP
jgi:multidrug efflux system membrane fusion protein